MTKRLVLLSTIVFFLIILSSFSLANYEIKDVSFQVGGKEISHILPQHSQVIDIVLNVSANESLSAVMADLTQINPDPTKFSVYKNKVMPCSKIEGEERDYYKCRVNSIVFVPQGVDNIINFTFSNSDGEETSINLTILLFYKEIRRCMNILKKFGIDMK